MAFTVVETRLVKNVGEEGLAYLIGSYTNTAGSTGGEILPGNNGANNNVAGSAGCKKILFVDVNSDSAAPSEPRALVAFESTIGGDKVTLTTGANQTGHFKLLCEYAGLPNS